jgi:hypothetical protein
VTNSFHATAFSINFKKPFIVPINRELSPEKALSSRITTLLKLLGIDDRLISAGVNLPESFSLDMDYGSVDVLLKQEINKSLDFLKKALGAI